MIVYCVRDTLAEDKNTYGRIVETIRRSGHTLAKDWESSDEKPGPENAAAAIVSSEVIIIDAADSNSFNTGYEMAIAIEHKKPILHLVKDSVAGCDYVLGMRNDLITLQVYTEENIEDIVAKFLKDNTVLGKDLRFNFVIDRQIYNHLRWKSFKSGKTKAEIIRDLLAEDIKKSPS